MEQKSLILKGLAKKEHGVGYDDVVVFYLTNIIIIQLISYALLDFIILDYALAGVILSALALVSLVNHLFFRLKWYFVARMNIMIMSLLQVTITSFLLFEWDAGFYMYYFIVMALAFALFDFGKRRDRLVIIIVIVIAVALFMSNRFVDFHLDVKHFSEETLKWLNYAASIISLTGVASLFWVFAEDVYTKRVALDKLANTDGLTQVMNRRRFFELAEGHYKKLKRKEGHMTLLIFDIDYFKKINDTYGHPVGDQILKELAFIVGESVRRSDLFARYGGEEFAVLLKDTKTENGLKVAEDIRKLVNEHHFMIGKKHEISISVSVGVASMSKEYEDFDTLLQVADRALYLAKEQGRNRVVGS